MKAAALGRVASRRRGRQSSRSLLNVADEEDRLAIWLPQLVDELLARRSWGFFGGGRLVKMDLDGVSNGWSLRSVRAIEASKGQPPRLHLEHFQLGDRLDVGGRTKQLGRLSSICPAGRVKRTGADRGASDNPKITRVARTPTHPHKHRAPRHRHHPSGPPLVTHNTKVAGSNPAPATKCPGQSRAGQGFFRVMRSSSGSPPGCGRSKGRRGWRRRLACRVGRVGRS